MARSKKEREINALFNLIETTRRDDASRFGATRQHAVTLFNTSEESEEAESSLVKGSVDKDRVLSFMEFLLAEERQAMVQRANDLKLVYTHTGELNLSATYKHDEVIRSVAGAHIGNVANYLPEYSPPMKNARENVFKQIAYDVYGHRLKDTARTIFSQSATEALYREMLVEGGTGKSKQDIVNMFKPGLLSVHNQKIETVIEVGYQRSLGYFSERLKKFDQVKVNLKELDVLSPSDLRFAVDPDSILMESSVRSFERPDIEILALPVKTKALSDFVSSIVYA